MSTQFKAGDRVEILTYPEFKGVTGIVTGYEKGDEPHRAIIRPDSGKWREVYFFDEYLRLIDSPAPVFKVGDRVESHSMGILYENYNGVRGVITKLPDSWGQYSIKSDGNQRYGNMELCFRSENLRLLCTQEDVDPVNKLNAPVFKVGDRVGYNYNGEITGRERTGIVIHEANESCKYVDVMFDDSKRSGYCWPRELRLLSTQPPQPQQTNEPKEEENMKPYAVIYHNLSGSNAASINAQFATEAEAKEHAESLVAGQRANIQTKAYFTVTIVNTKTGQLVGSVSDVPPAVNWNASAK